MLGSVASPSAVGTVPDMKKSLKYTAIGSAALLAALFTIGTFTGSSAPQPATFNQLVEASTNPDLDKVTMNIDAGTATFTFTNGDEVSGQAPRTWMEDTATELAEDGVEVNTAVISETPLWRSLLLSLLPIAILVGVIVWVVRSQMGGHGKAGKSLLQTAERPSTTLADVEGMPETVETMKEITRLWASELDGTGVSPLKGALLVGPPGTGKTLLARAMAGETGCPILASNGSEFNEVFAGVGAKRVRKLFETARKVADKEGRVIVFIDEIDSIAAARAQNDMGSDSGKEHAQTLNAILHELDGFTPEERIFLIGATNRPEILDPAMLRPGRFDRVITVGLPDATGRARILKLYVDKQNKTSLPVADEFDVETFSRRCPGASGAELSEIVSTAARMAYLNGSSEITTADMSEALAEVAVGRARKSAMMEGEDLDITAWHEAGHTVAALVLPDTPDPVEVTVVPRGPAGGITWLPERDSPYHTREQLHADLVVALAGRAGELSRPSGRVTTGAASDLDKATSLATAMVCKYGMRPAGGVGVLSPDSDKVETEVEMLISEAQHAAEVLIADHADLLRAVVADLVDNETVTRARLRELRDIHTPSVSVVEVAEEAWETGRCMRSAA